MSSLITDSGEVIPEWLTDILRSAGRLPRGFVVDARTAVESSFTSVIVRLVCSYSPDAPPTAPSRLFLKLSRLDLNQRVVGSEQRQREVMFHNSVIKTIPDPPTVSCHYAAHQGKTGTSLLLFDDVSETHFGGDMSLPADRFCCERAMDSFADFHAFWWDNPLLSEVDKLPDKDSESRYIAGAEASFPGFADAFRDRLSGGTLQIYERVLDRLAALRQRLVRGKDLTLIHGDANFTNVLLPRDPGKGRSLIIDWQLWNTSYGAEDLSHLIALFWDKNHRQAMEYDLLIRYHKRLVERGVKRYEWTDCWHDYRLAVILRVLFMPIWFWTAGSPPAWCHARLDNAIQAFTNLGCEELLK